MELIVPPPDADTPDTGTDDPTTNPRGEIEALERAHILIANGAIQRIADHQYEISILRGVVFEHGQRALHLRALAMTLPPGGDIASGLQQAMFDALRPGDLP